ncbi:TPA: hypothetical protein SMO99_002977 [Proteus mirabilis]|uniref:Uncharacterized protein n=2 Tax=Morganellaceae TaxID=1903414 RepID=A0AAI9HVU6_MORMO|nr:hypothetical protein [Providencia rettgeri]EKW8763103.1 hypothetical protein [Morganella morganii]HEJ9425186.1 hypothetical protein [Proteus mirabilis]ELI9034869.1 hypothetical protein [Morganella morganii]MBX6949530.1 hypothetical protein [Providencia rettgeri]MBX6956378.1 hypothetical protein [Providencia rettgeri]
MKLNIDKCISFTGRYAWSIVAFAVMLQVLSVAVLVKSLLANNWLDGGVIAAILQLLAILFFSISRYALKVHFLDKAGGPDAYLAQKIQWPEDQFYTDLVDNVGVKEEFNAWYSQQVTPISIAEFDKGLITVISTTYSLKQEEQISDRQFLKLLMLKYAGPLFKWLSIGSMLFAAAATVLLFNSMNSLKEGYPFIVLPFCLAIMFHSLRRAVSAKSSKLILERPISPAEIDGLMRLAATFNLHREFCELMRSPQRPKTISDAHRWLTNKAEGTETFFG